MTKKEARAECRLLTAQTGWSYWEMCWDKINGFYPAPHPPRGSKNTAHYCYVDKSGALRR